MNQYLLREQQTNNDLQAIEKILSSYGPLHFSKAEVSVALELLEDRLIREQKSEYNFVFVEIENLICGFSCWGPIACTVGSYDLYWIAVDQNFQGKGLGAKLLSYTETQINSQSGRNIYIETSTRDPYIPAQNFYLKHGYKIEAKIKDFYNSGDHKLIFSKALTK